jgi:two-component system sensor histidine kinase PilS (NtrC family)
MNPREADRRGGDRRQNDRRAAPGRRREDDGGFESTRDGDSFFDPGWLAAGESRDDDQRLTRQARRLARAQESSLARVYRTYAAARAVIGLGLLAMQVVGGGLGLRTSERMALIALSYAAQAITLWLLPRFNRLAAPQFSVAQKRRQWIATIGVDLLAFTCLHALEVGAAFNYAALLVLPVLMAGVLTRRIAALGTAAAVALMLLGLSWHAGLDTPEASAHLLQSGLAGLGLFMVTLLAGELASRLAREELAARGSMELARQQAQLNRLVIEEMADGVLVVDRHLGVRAANPAARALLVDQGGSVPAPFNLAQRIDWAELRLAVQQALEAGNWPEAGRDVTLGFTEGLTRTLRLRVRFMRGRHFERSPEDGGAEATGVPDEPYVVLLLEDLRTLQARIRQEKLAAMGRVSAGIAHEIRNPLMAISQANALLLEDGLPPAQQRLAQMVADNVLRLKRLVDDVMEVAPGMPPESQAIDASSAIAQTVVDWARTAEIAFAPDSRLRTDLPATQLGVVFDAEHLRRVLVNLLDNAHRHAGTQPGSIFLRVSARDDDWVVMSVLSDGALIAPEIERFLFEPFFSTRSRGSGLGLYICRELCERYGASIEYRPRPAAERLRNEFAVSMRRAALPDADLTLPLEPN